MNFGPLSMQCPSPQNQAAISLFATKRVQLLRQCPDFLERNERKRFLPGPRLSERKRLPNRVQQREHAAQPAGVADVAGEFWVRTIEK